MIKKKLQGFTIIEVVLVLAIAGLIFLMVFIALPTLQANQRDTQRRDDLSRFKAQLNQYTANNKGKIPAAGCNAAGVQQFTEDYLKDNWNDPKSGARYTCATDVPSDPGSYYYATSSKCDGEAIVSAGTNSMRSYAVITKLEGSGKLCMDNQ